MGVIYKYHKGPVIDLDYSLLDDPGIWPKDWKDKETSPLVVLYRWFWEDRKQPIVSLREAREDITNVIDLDAAIDIILNDWSIEHIGDNAGVLFTGNGTRLGEMKNLIRHFHGPTKVSNYENCANLTVVVPVKIVEPVTEILCINHHDNPPWGEFDKTNITGEDQLTIAEMVSVDGEVTRIKLPEAGEYLVFDFDGSRDYHWVENISNNHFIFFVLEGYVK